MNIEFTFKGLDSTETLINQVNEKISHLKKYFHGDIRLEVIFELENTQRQVKCNVKRKGINEHFYDNGNDWSASIEKVFKKVDHYLQKQKDKSKHH